MIQQVSMQSGGLLESGKIQCNGHPTLDFLLNALCLNICQCKKQKILLLPLRSDPERHVLCLSARKLYTREYGFYYRENWWHCLLFKDACHFLFKSLFSMCLWFAKPLLKISSWDLWFWLFASGWIFLESFR